MWPVGGATFFALSPYRQYWRSASSLRWSGGRCSCCASWVNSGDLTRLVLGPAPAAAGLHACGIEVWSGAIPLFRVAPDPAQMVDHDRKVIAAQRTGREHGRPNVGGTTQKATAQRFSSTTIRLPNTPGKQCSALQSITESTETSLPQNMWWSNYLCTSCSSPMRFLLGLQHRAA